MADVSGILAGLEKAQAKAYAAKDRTRVQGLRSLLRKLEKMERESQRKNNGDVVVGFAASYAMAVHEDAKGEARRRLRAKGSFGQQWKFLEQPAREKQKEIAQVVVGAVKGGATLIQALLMGGLRLQREAQDLVPVKTGNLKASAFTEKD